MFAGETQYQFESSTTSPDAVHAIN